MKMNFDWNCVAAGAPYITISETSISINDFASNLIGNPEHVAVGFDEKNMIIGITPHNGDKNIKSYSFFSRKKNGWIRIGCKDFIKYLSTLTDMSFAPAIRYIAKYEKDSNLLYISILENSDFENDDIDDEKL